MLDKLGPLPRRSGTSRSPGTYRYWSDHSHDLCPGDNTLAHQTGAEWCFRLADGTDYRVASPGFGCAASSRSISALNAAKGCAPIRLASVVTFELLGSV